MTIVYFHDQPPHLTTGPPTLVLYGGPGTGKSTTAALVFGILKQRGYNVEIVHEVAKDMVWEERHIALLHQPYINVKQMFRLDRLRDKVQGIITDTSTLLSFIYGTREGGVTKAFRDWILDDYRRRNTVNVFLMRNPDRAYNPQGRTQSEDEAAAADQQIRTLLIEHKINHYRVHMGRKDEHITQIADIFEQAIKRAAQ